jgi:hypothetical protein
MNLKKKEIIKPVITVIKTENIPKVAANKRISQVADPKK